MSHRYEYPTVSPLQIQREAVTRDTFNDSNNAEVEVEVEPLPPTPPNHWEVKLEHAHATVEWLQYQVGRYAMRDQLQLDFKTPYVIPRKPEF